VAQVQHASRPAKGNPPPQALNRRAADKVEHRRRASDHMPTVDTDKLAAAAEAAIKAAMKPAVDRAVHKGVQAALAQAVAATVPQPQGAPAKPASAPQAGATAPVQANPQAAQPEAPVVRNGVRCPDHDSVTGKLWLLYGQAGAAVTLTQAKQLAEQNGLNPSSAAIALYNWRKFHGVKSPTAR
jgi:hypothetical protein